MPFDRRGLNFWNYCSSSFPPTRRLRKRLFFYVGSSSFFFFFDRRFYSLLFCLAVVSFAHYFILRVCVILLCSFISSCIFLSRMSSFTQILKIVIGHDESFQTNHRWISKWTNKFSLYFVQTLKRQYNIIIYNLIERIENDWHLRINVFATNILHFFQFPCPWNDFCWSTFVSHSKYVSTVLNCSMLPSTMVTVSSRLLNVAVAIARLVASNRVAMSTYARMPVLMFGSNEFQTRAERALLFHAVGPRKTQDVHA